MVYKVSKAVEKKVREYERKGYKINQTTDSNFLSRRPQNRKDLIRIGKYLGTGGGSHVSTSIFAYKDKKKR